MKLGAPDKSGRRTPVPVKGSEFVIDLDTLIIAIGETTDLSFLNKESNIDISKRGTITVNNETFATKVKGVFAGGDVVTGPATVIEAMSSGKIAAEMIDKYLEGEKVEREYNLTRPSIYIPPVELTEEEIEDSARPQMPDLPINKRKNSFDEVDLGLSEKTAVKEARRCLRCDLETEDGKRAIKALEEKQKEEGGKSNVENQTHN